MKWGWGGAAGVQRCLQVCKTWRERDGWERGCFWGITSALAALDSAVAKASRGMDGRMQGAAGAPEQLHEVQLTRETSGTGWEHHHDQLAKEQSVLRDPGKALLLPRAC